MNIKLLFVWTESWSIWRVGDLSQCHSDERPHLPTTKWTLPLAEPLPTVLRFVRGRSMFHSWWENWDFIFCVEDKNWGQICFKSVNPISILFEYMLNFTGLILKMYLLKIHTTKEPITDKKNLSFSSRKIYWSFL